MAREVREYDEEKLFKIAKIKTYTVKQKIDTKD
jgi:hypothetical protein